jgi:signal transduction histidine kinase
MDDTMDLAQSMAARLRGSRDELTHEWLHRLLGQLDAASHRSVPIQHLLELAPLVVNWLADRLLAPDAPAEDISARFREVVEVQQSRGRRAGEVARDIDLLADLVFDLLRDQIAESSGSAPGLEAAEVGGRLRCAFSLLTLSIVDAYEEKSRRERRELRGRVEEFVRTLSHELKNPLGAAEIALQMLEDEEMVANPGERERYREMVARNVKRGRVLIDDLRARALPDLGFAASEEWVPLPSVLQDVIAEVLPTAEGQGVRLRADDVPGSWAVPTREAKLVVMNLVWNAVKYSDPGKPERWVRVRVRAGSTNDVGLIEVEDNGVGIAAELQERVFERFFRVNPEQKNGTGLGLAIAREAVEEVGGGLWLQSEPGRGSTFTVALPVRELPMESPDG